MSDFERFCHGIGSLLTYGISKQEAANAKKKAEVELAENGSVSEETLKKLVEATDSVDHTRQNARNSSLLGAFIKDPYEEQQKELYMQSRVNELKQIYSSQEDIEDSVNQNVAPSSYETNTYSGTDYIEQLERISKLFQAGLIDESEFKELKRKILDV